MGKWLKSNPTLCDVIYGQPLQLYSYLFPQSDSENDHVEFMDKKDDFEEISSMVEKSTQTLVEEQKIVEKLKKKLSATKSSQLRKGKIFGVVYKWRHGEGSMILWREN